jgi:hypothetical protein
MTEDEKILIEGAKHFPTPLLTEMYVEKMDLAFEAQNTGPLKVALIMGRELERRGVTNQKQRKFLDSIEKVITMIEDEYNKKIKS